MKGLKNEKGFVLAQMIFVLPILGLAFLVSSAAVQIATERSRSLNQCRSSLLEVQRKMKSTLEELLKLNPKATKLRKEKQVAEKALKSSAGTPAMAAAVAYYNSVVVRQLELRSRQQWLLRNAETFSQDELLKLRRLIGNQKTVVQRKGVRSLSLPITHSLAVHAEPAFSLSPSYEPSWDMPIRQKIEASWSFSLSQLLHGELIRLLDLKFQRFDFKCGATLKRDGLSWKVSLTK
jgi:hypothetical protein